VASFDHGTALLKQRLLRVNDQLAVEADLTDW
jgi:hypothetical protein